ncbi:MAG: hypothetical protein ACT4O5_08205 [Gammaproteobacteria bacterium]
MLPDFPETKRLFSRFFQAHMRVKLRQISPYSMVQTRYLHEGRMMQVMRPDDTQSQSELVQLSSPIEMKFDEIETLTLQKVLEKYDAVVTDMVRKQVGLVRERMSAEIPESQAVDARGRKLDADLVMETLEKMQIEFYPDGTPHELLLDGPPFARERMTAIEKEISESPELKRKFDDMMARKKEQWRAREASRKLVG